MASQEQSRDVVIGSGPNGLAAAILLARAGRRVAVYEANQEIGGGTRSAELTLPGFVHDVCSAIHPMAIASPCFETFPLASYGLEWIYPPAPVAHPLDDGTAVMVEHSIEETARGLEADGAAWAGLMTPLVKAWPELRHDVFSLRLPPRHPFAMARFGMRALRSARGFAESLFRGVRARAVFAGLAAHAQLPLEDAATASFGLVFGISAHSGGWPLPRGGSRRIAEALAAYLRSLGGEIETGRRIAELPQAPLVFCDITPRQFLAMAGQRLPAGFRHSLERFRYGPGVFKMDWALDGPIPWRAAECARAGTVHLGGTLEEIAQWEATYRGSPFVLVAQQSLFDSTRAPEGKHTAWAYCHIPNGSTEDMTAIIEAQMERFAPGFKDRILARHAMGPAELERRNANDIGGDVSGGSARLSQLFLRPTRRIYKTPLRGVYFCSASTPPGGGVHGMCGYNAVKAALGTDAVK